jgi:hypothetical protein
MQRDVLTFVRWETVAIRNFRPDVVLEPFEMVLELLGRHPSEAFVCVVARVSSGRVGLLWGPRLLCILVQHEHQHAFIDSADQPLLNKTELKICLNWVKIRETMQFLLSHNCVRIIGKEVKPSIATVCVCALLLHLNLYAMFRPIWTASVV